ncbi:MAG TPA: glycosyltransferase family 2 protein [Bacteroidales bacterium]|nr:glycosyltransferase family 2 protein [Bacteroidales bacterium]HSA44735.1 glycosyltransferase family 2 protein [Bacteroidales bacterium]
MSRVAVVILNWNGRKFLERFLPSVIAHSGQARMIIADNASTDDSVSYLEQHFPDIEIIRNDDNGGFSKGYNDALCQVDAEYYVLLNSDIEVTPGWIEPLVEMMDHDPGIAACQPKILSFHEPEMFEYAGAAGGFIDHWGYPFCRGRIFLTLEKDEQQYDQPSEIFWATGACLFVRASLYHQLGGLDNDFFAHMEEIDFCWRLKNEGYRIMYCPGSKVYHVGGGTLPKISWRKTYLNFRNNLILLYKNLPAGSILPVFLVRHLLDFLAGLKFLSDGDTKDFLAVIRAYFSFYRMFGKIRRKRSSLTHHRVSLIYRKSIVLDYYLRKKRHFSMLDPDKFRA